MAILGAVSVLARGDPAPGVPPGLWSSASRESAEQSFSWPAAWETSCPFDNWCPKCTQPLPSRSAPQKGPLWSVQPQTLRLSAQICNYSHSLDKSSHVSCSHPLQKKRLWNHLFTPGRVLVFPCKLEIRDCTETGLKLKQVDVYSWSSRLCAKATCRTPKPAQEALWGAYSRHKKAEGATLLGENAACHPQRQLAAARDEGRSCCLSRGWEAVAWGGLGGLFARGQEGKDSEGKQCRV